MSIVQFQIEPRPRDLEFTLQQACCSQKKWGLQVISPFVAGKSDVRHAYEARNNRGHTRGMGNLIREIANLGFVNVVA